MNRRLIIKLGILLFFIFILIFSIYFAFKEQGGGILTVAFLDVGQGDAILTV